MLVILGLCGCLTFNAAGDNATTAFIVMFSLALFFGVAMVMPIGGADMPVVISLLNSFTGLAVAADGFAINNLAMIVAGTLVGSSGTLLTLLMCKAMNRPVTNVLVRRVWFERRRRQGRRGRSSAEKPSNPFRPTKRRCCWATPNRSSSCPATAWPWRRRSIRCANFPMNSASAAWKCSFAIHPVAGRMPGHMNVLLAEANVPYDQLCEMEAINPTMDRVDVCLVIGANDVVNPAAREDKSSPIYGMPIIEADRAKTVIVMKRSMAAGFAGIENHLVLQGQHADALRRRESLVANAHRTVEGKLSRRITRGWRKFSRRFAKLSLDARAGAFHQFFNFLFRRHGSVAGRGHGQRAVRRAVIHGLLRIAGGHQTVDQAGGKTVAAADTVENFQVGIFSALVKFAVHPADGAPSR